MKNYALIKFITLVLILTSCNNQNGNNSNAFSNLMSNPQILSGLIGGQSTNEIAKSVLLNNIGIGNITGGSNSGASTILSSVLGGNNGDLANATLSNGLFENILSQTLNSAGYLNNKNPQYLLNADISNISNALSGNGANGVVNYNLVNQATGNSVLSKALSSSGGSNGAGALTNNSTELISLLNGFKR